jgi:uncharacterized membrane protein
MSQTKVAKFTGSATAPKSTEAAAPAKSTEKAAPPRASDALALKLSSAEFTTTLSHFHRAEIARMAGWRDRLDRTSNWAITVVAALLSVSLSTPTAHHGVLIFAVLLDTLLLYVEARRYRFYDVYRMRVRQFERHYFAPTFAALPATEGADPWLQMLSQDLRHPRFRIDLMTAVTRRLRRNYIWMYAILLLAWVLKITSPKLQEGHAVADTARPIETIVGNAALGPVPGWLVIGAMAAFFIALCIVALRTRTRADDDEVHV